MLHHYIGLGLMAALVIAVMIQTLPNYAWFAIGIVVLAYAWGWLCRRHPLVGWFLLCFIRGLTSRR